MSNQEVQTPQWFMDSLQSVVGLSFRYDMAASPENAKAPVWYTEEQDSLAIDWPTDGLCWVNPPFKYLKLWFAKYQEQAIKGAKIVAISPISSDKYTEFAWCNNTVCPIVGRVWKLEVRSCMLTFWNVPKPSILKVVDNKLEWIW